MIDALLLSSYEWLFYGHSFLNKGTPLIQTEKQVRKSFQIHLLIRSQKLKDRTQKDHQFLFQVARPQNNILLTSPLIVPKSLWSLRHYDEGLFFHQIVSEFLDLDHNHELQHESLFLVALSLQT